MDQQYGLRRWVTVEAVVRGSLADSILAQWEVLLLESGRLRLQGADDATLSRYAELQGSTGALAGLVIQAIARGELVVDAMGASEIVTVEANRGVKGQAATPAHEAAPPSAAYAEEMRQVNGARDRLMWALEAVVDVLGLRHWFSTGMSNELMAGTLSAKEFALCVKKAVAHRIDTPM